MKLALAAALLLASTPVVASEQQAGYSRTKTCYRSEYREEYIPGTEDDPGYVRSWKETIEFPCDNNKATIHRPTRTIVETHREVDDNDCSEGTLAGGLIGGGLGAALSRGNGRWWAVPTGIVTGAMIGCDIDGG
tara:strand:- start:46 stop:447 length:402 start_codon:yes stop_codon:yes gene_type:complete